MLGVSRVNSYIHIIRRNETMIGVEIIGVGKAIPGYDGVSGIVLDNSALSKLLFEEGKYYAGALQLEGDERVAFMERFTTNSDWILERTEIKTRSFADRSIATSDLAAIAGDRALLKSNMERARVQRLGIATVTPDYLLSPPTFSLVQEKLSLCKKIHSELPILFGNDTTVACSSFVAEFINAYNAIASGQCENALVIGADTMSRTTYDRGMRVLLGDGAGAIVLRACAREKSAFEPTSFTFGSDGRSAERIIARTGGSCTPATIEDILRGTNKLSMQGNAVFKEILNLIYDEKNPEGSVIGQGLSRAKRTLQEIDVLFFHQANNRMTKLSEEKLRRCGLRTDAVVFNNIERYGNTTSATIPLLMTEAYEQKILQFGKRFMVVVFGGGYTWGTISGMWTMW